MKSARDGWNAAQIASERELPKKRKMHGPVGGKVNSEEGAWRAHVSVGRGTFIGFGEVSCCAGCGYHVCSCEPAAPEPFEMPRTVRVGSRDVCCRCWAAECTCEKKSFFVPDDYQRHIDAHNQAAIELYRGAIARKPRTKRLTVDEAAAECRNGRLAKNVCSSPAIFMRWNDDAQKHEGSFSRKVWFDVETIADGKPRWEIVEE